MAKSSVIIDTDPVSALLSEAGESALISEPNLGLRRYTCSANGFGFKQRGPRNIADLSNLRKCRYPKVKLLSLIASALLLLMFEQLSS